MFGLTRKNKVDAPAPSEAVHVAPNGRRSLCGQSMKGEAVLPDDTPVTCKPCADRYEGRR